MATVTQTVQRNAQPQHVVEPMVVLLKSPENNQEQAKGSWLNTALGVALVAGALYGASRFGYFDSFPNAEGMADTARSYFWSGVGQVATATGLIVGTGYMTKEVAQNAGPKVAEGLVNAGGKVVSKTIGFLPSVTSFAVNGLAKAGGLGVRFVTSLLPLGNRLSSET